MQVYYCRGLELPSLTSLVELVIDRWMQDTVFSSVEWIFPLMKNGQWKELRNVSFHIKSRSADAFPVDMKDGWEDFGCWLGEGGLGKLMRWTLQLDGALQYPSRANMFYTDATFRLAFLPLVKRLSWFCKVRFDVFQELWHDDSREEGYFNGGGGMGMGWLPGHGLALPALPY